MLDMSSATAVAYDPLTPQSTFTSAQIADVAQAIIVALGVAWDADGWELRYDRVCNALCLPYELSTNIQPQQGPRQKDDYNCGVFVLASCLAAIARATTDLPTIDCSLWRSIFRKLLDFDEDMPVASFLPPAPASVQPSPGPYQHHKHLRQRLEQASQLCLQAVHASGVMCALHSQSVRKPSRLQELDSSNVPGGPIARACDMIDGLCFDVRSMLGKIKQDLHGATH